MKKKTAVLMYPVDNMVEFKQILGRGHTCLKGNELGCTAGAAYDNGATNHFVAPFVMKDFKKFGYE